MNIDWLLVVADWILVVAGVTLWLLIAAPILGFLYYARRERNVKRDARQPFQGFE